MKYRIAAIAIVVTWGGAAIRFWRRHPRVGAGTVNRIVNPWLLRQGMPEASRGEIGLLEHVGRRSGTVRATPVHPVRTPDGFRVIVPLGGESQWARNVLTAGHCRLEVDGVVHELDEPRFMSPIDVEGVPQLPARLMAWLGFRYLRLHQFAEHPGMLAIRPEIEPAETQAEVRDGELADAVKAPKARVEGRQRVQAPTELPTIEPPTDATEPVEVA